MSMIKIMSTTGHHRSGQWHSVKGSIAIVPSRRRHHPIGYRMLQNTAWQFPSRSHKATFDQKLTRLLRRLHVPACSLSHDRYFSPQLAVVWLGGNEDQSGEKMESARSPEVPPGIHPPSHAVVRAVGGQWRANEWHLSFEAAGHWRSQASAATVSLRRSARSFNIALYSALRRSYSFEFRSHQ